MIGLEVSWTLIVDLIVLPLIFAVAVFVFLDSITSFWRDVLEFARIPLGLPGAVGTQVSELGNYAVAIPYLMTPASWPEPLDLRTGWLVTGLMMVAGLFMRGRLLPIGYLLRALSVIQLTAQLWFSFMSPPFAYSLSEYGAGLLLFGVVILILSPFLVAFTFHIFDFRLWQKMAMAGLLLLHLTVLLPLQVLVHSWIIHRASLLAMPILFLVFGILLDLFVYVALYGWGMSWRSGGALDALDRRPPEQRPARYPPTRPRPTPTPQSVRAITPLGQRVVQAVRFSGALGGMLLRKLSLHPGAKP